MVKRIVMIVCLVLLIGVGFISYLKSNPPLVSGAIGSSSNHKVLLIEVGNKSNLGNVHIEEVYINGGIKPEKVMLQVSNPLGSLAITDQFEGKEVEGYQFEEVDSVEIEPQTVPTQNLEKVNNHTASEEDSSYALSIGHEEEVYEVTVSYRYLGFAFENVLTID
ncbi:hypothetical protein JOC85_003174 [Bacillus mesophilus]|uniref:Uncharacterized protein n=1 Tax=Bacillus mesophilus TaxID=1808955 RepID=A0A6M0Q9H9_9BACI|nr:hypothetical protein [Bacillus mesophilus]MBM7662367.1 hypothetical protein [Bacillus mesophilus]NEY73004.1 hypothetical protein [Bacillus mesophilus]